MVKRTKLCDRHLPAYSAGEEIMNMVTHIVGGGFGVIALVLCVVRAALYGNAMDIVGCAIFGGTMVCLYTVSSVYHGLHPGTGKKVMQIIDHCTIYYLIIGTYTAILMTAFIPHFPVQGWTLLGAEWGLGILATVFTAIDLHNYRVFSMICYIGMGWGIILFLPQILAVMTLPGFLLLLSGGIAYTLGAVLYGLGVKMPWMHSVFHIFVVLGSLLQFLSILLYAI